MDKKLSLAVVARKVGISESYLARIEADKQKPLPQTVQKITEFLKMNESKELVLDTMVHYAKSYTQSQTAVSKDDLIKSKEFSKLFKRKKG